MNDFVNTALLTELGFEIVGHVQAAKGHSKIRIGTPSHCRFCHEANPAQFRTVAHTIPEGIGNHWIISNDECDNCNKLFSQYDDALCQSVGALLSLSGMTGKGNKVRKTGRTSGASRIVHDSNTGTSSLTLDLMPQTRSAFADVQPAISFFSGGTNVVFPTANESFIPRKAYKSLAKIGLSIVPPERMETFHTLLSWVRDADDILEFPFLEVAISYGSIESAPPIVAATLLARQEFQPLNPRYLLVVTTGCLCFQIELMDDEPVGERQPVRFGTLGIPWSVKSKNPKRTPNVVAYNEIVRLDWSSNLAQPVPIHAIEKFDDAETGFSSFKIRWRDELRN